MAEKKYGVEEIEAMLPLEGERDWQLGGPYWKDKRIVTRNGGLEYVADFGRYIQSKHNASFAVAAAPIIRQLLNENNQLRELYEAGLRHWNPVYEIVLNERDSLRTALGGMVAAFNTIYADAEIARITRESAMSVANQTLGWPNTVHLEPAAKSAAEQLKAKAIEVVRGKCVTLFNDGIGAAHPTNDSFNRALWEVIEAIDAGKGGK